MFKNKSDNRNNVCGEQIADLRKNSIPKMSQRMLAEELAHYGIILDKNAIQRIECGKRFITDIELVAFSRIFHVSYEELLGEKIHTR